jgi:hypothetical protein
MTTRKYPLHRIHHWHHVPIISIFPLYSHDILYTWISIYIRSDTYACILYTRDMVVSKNGGTPKSGIVPHKPFILEIPQWWKAPRISIRFQQHLHEITTGSIICLGQLTLLPWFSHGFPMAEVNTPLVILFLNGQVSNPLDEKTQMKAAPPTGYSNSAQSPGLVE